MLPTILVHIDSDIVGCIRSCLVFCNDYNRSRVLHIQIDTCRFATCYHDGVWVVNI